MKPADVVVLISGRGSNMAALLDHSRGKDAPFRLAAVISNEADAPGLELAAGAAVATRVLDHRQFASRAEYDAALHETVSGFRPQLVALAGFMRILTSAFIDPFLGRLINIHPSLLPKYRGLDTHERALAGGDTVHGASVHYVVPELDAGPVIAQVSVAVKPNDTPDSLAARVLRQEHRLYPRVVRWCVEGRARLGNGTVVFDDRPLHQPLVVLEDDGEAGGESVSEGQLSHGAQPGTP